MKNIIKDLRITLKNIKKIQNLIQERQTNPADLNKKILIFISKSSVFKRDTLNMNKLIKAFKKLFITIRLKKTDRLLKLIVN